MSSFNPNLLGRPQKPGLPPDMDARIFHRLNPRIWLRTAFRAVFGWLMRSSARERAQQSLARRAVDEYADSIGVPTRIRR